MFKNKSRLFIKQPDLQGEKLGLVPQEKNPPRMFLWRLRRYAQDCRQQREGKEQGSSLPPSFGVFVLFVFPHPFSLSFLALPLLRLLILSLSHFHS